MFCILTTVNLLCPTLHIFEFQNMLSASVMTFFSQNSFNKVLLVMYLCVLPPSMGLSHIYMSPIYFLTISRISIFCDCLSCLSVI